MTPPLHLLQAAAAGELVLLSLTVMLRLRANGLTVSEAGACAPICVLMLLAMMAQAVAALEVPVLLPVLESALVIAGGVGLYSQRRPLARLFESAVGFGRAHPLAAFPLLIVLCAGAIEALALPGANGSGGAASWPYHHRVLADLFCRRGEAGGLLGLTGYAVIGLATYALARRYAWPATAVTVALVVLSHPRLVLLAPGSGAELLPAAGGIFCLLSLYRTVEHPDPLNLALLTLGLGFTLSPVPLGRVLPMVLAGLSAVVLYRRHGGRYWGRLLTSRPRATAAVAAALLLLAPPWRPAAFPPSAVTTAYLNEDGIAGATANLVRYLLQSIDLMPAVDQWAQWLWQVRLSDRMERLYDLLVQPLFGMQGAAAPFTVTWGFDPDTAGFGPAGCFLVLPAVMYALLRGPRRLKAVAVAMLVYGYLAALIPAWRPVNAALFTRFFACCGFMTAFMLPPWRLTRQATGGLQVFCVLLAIYTLMGRWMGG